MQYYYHFVYIAMQLMNNWTLNFRVYMLKYEQIWLIRAQSASKFGSKNLTLG